MELETVMGYLVALALPLWLLVEQVMHWQWSSKQPAKRFKLGKLSGKPASLKTGRRIARPDRRAVSLRA